MESDTQPEVVDQSVLNGYPVLHEHGQPEVITELIGIFLEDLPNKPAVIRSAVDSGDPKAIRSAANALEGASASIGAVRLSSRCAELRADR